MPGLLSFDMIDLHDSDRRLWRIRFLHTAIWAVIASAILAIPFAVLSGRLELAALFSVLVWIEIGILLVFGWRCPLTGIAARYTDEQADGFDIFLPPWLARNNKTVFGILFVFGEAMMLWRWIVP